MTDQHIAELVERLRNMALREMDDLSHDLNAAIPLLIWKAADALEHLSQQERKEGR